MKFLLILLIIANDYLVELRSPDHLYRIKEELPINHVIGYLNTDISKFRNGESVSYKILNTRDKGVHCLAVDETSSKLTISGRIDRESLCSQSSLVCYITLKVALHGSDRFVTIKIEIEDINDHSPSWPHSKLKVTFNDGENAGSRISLPIATDLDSGENGEIKYSLESMTNAFMLVQEHGLYLQTLKQIDREVIGTYEISVLAIDRGSIARSSRLDIEVVIVDVNDNSPRFSTSVFRPAKVIPETIPVGSVVLTLAATDADSGQNGEFSFSFSPTEMSAAKSYFFLKPSGEIIVQRQLDYDNGNQKFEFKVIVEDHASPGYERSSESRVEITVSDENDEFPVVKVYPINTNTETGFAKVDENKAAMTPVALVQATDKDFKETDAVTCTSRSYGKSESLTLIPTNENNEYKLVTSRPFDRETEQRISVNIACVDAANHKQSINVTIEVADVNDNAPRFLENVFHFYVRENMEPGTVVRNRFSATDSDDAENGSILYSIAGTDEVPFSIESRSAVLRTKERLDRERKAFYQFPVIATDRGKPPKSSSATIVVHIEDENDNPVVIDSFPNEFRIGENLPSNTPVGRVVAKDNDNQTIFYYIDQDSDAVRFKIDRHDGSITTKTQLDREVNQKFQFRVFATDKLHTASIMITVFVDDANDNAPKFKMPNNTVNSITVSPSEAAGYTLAKITAEDPDERENAQIQYFITNTKVNTLFSLDKDSGVLYLESTLHSSRSDDRDHIAIDLEACDMGKIRKCTAFKGFKVYLQKGADTTNAKGQPNLLSEGSGFSESIIVGLIGFLLMMILVTIIIIILLRRKTKGNTIPRKEAQLAVSGQSPYFQSPNGKSPFESDQCSAEICELTSRLSPDQEMAFPINQFAYYNIGDQYQSGNIINVSGDHAYHMPFVTSYQPQSQQMIDPRTMQRITDNIGYYSKYEMNDNQKFLDDTQPNFLNNELKHSTISSVVTTTVSSPKQKCKKLPSNTIRKPQTSFV